MAFASKRACTALLLTSIFGAVATTGPVKAAIVSDSPSLPLLGVPYTSPTGAGCFTLAGVCVTPGTFVLTSTVSSTFTVAGQDIVADASYDGTLTTLGGALIGSFSLTGTVEELVLGRTSDTELGSWTTDLVMMSLSGPVLGHTLTATQDPTNPSTGLTSIESIDVGNQQRFRIDSFFDVFIDVSLSGTGLSASVGPISVEAVPEPPVWTLMILGFAGLAFAGRSRLAARSTR